MERSNARGDKPRDQPTRTHTKEYGYYIRNKWTKGKKRKQKTLKVKKNTKKVVLGKINDIEVYVLPYDFPDKVFMGIFPMSTVLDKGDLPKVMGIYNKMRWFLNEEWQKQPRSEKGAKYPRRRIVEAFNLGLKHRKEAQKSKESFTN